MNQETIKLIQTASDFIEELRRMGYGETGDRALPGSFDSFVAALEAARERMVDQALEQDNS